MKTTIITGKDRYGNIQSATVTTREEQEESKVTPCNMPLGHYFVSDVPQFIPPQAQVLTALAGIKQREDRTFYQVLRDALGQLHEYNCDNPTPMEICNTIQVYDTFNGLYTGGFAKNELYLHNTKTGKILQA